MFLYDDYSSFHEALLRLNFYHILLDNLFYDAMTRASLLHEPICRYPAQERWALR